jgi:hypothetical protein
LRATSFSSSCRRGSRYTVLANRERYIEAYGQLAQALRARYGLRELPLVVKNAPERRPRDVETDGELSDIRTDCGVPPGGELIVYSGWVSAERGLATVVAALRQLPRVHFAIQVSDRGRCVELEEQAKALRVDDRLHVVPYVAAHQVVDYLRTASVGVIPTLRTDDGDCAFESKYFEYMHARLPIVTSDVRQHAEMTRELHNGEVFTAGDAGSFARATREVLSNRDRYATAYAEPGVLEANSWEAQMPELLGLYAQVSGMAPSRAYGPPISRSCGTASVETQESKERAAPSLSRVRGFLSSRAELPASAVYWEERYRSGGTSGSGSYSPYAEMTAEIINRIFRERKVEGVIEFGCGDGNQLSHLRVAKYVGLDVAPTAIKRCAERFRDDRTKRFFVYNPQQHVDGSPGYSADCSLSKEVIFHLVEDDIFETHMRHLFASGRRLVVIVASDLDWHLGPYERHRRFTPWVEANLPEWRLVEKIDSPAPYEFDTGKGMLSNVYVFQRKTHSPETFVLDGVEHPYYRDYDGDPGKVPPALSERTVELPIGYSTMRAFADQRRLEVGNTLEHWYPDLEPGVTHDVVDKFERRPGVINEDILDFQPDRGYDLVLSLSTLEHVGKPEYGDPGGEGKAIAAVLHCVDLLLPAGMFVATIPRGWNETLEQALREGELAHISRLYMARVDEANHWVQVADYNGIAGCGYDRPYRYANGIYVLRARA